MSFWLLCFSLCLIACFLSALLYVLLPSGVINHLCMYVYMYVLYHNTLCTNTHNMQKLGSIDFSAPSTPYFWWGMSSLTFPSGIDAPGKHDSRLIRRRASELICEIIQTGKSVLTRGEISPNCSVYIGASFAHLPDISIQPIPIRVIHVDGRDRFADVQRNISARTGQNQFMGVRESRL